MRPAPESLPVHPAESPPERGPTDSSRGGVWSLALSLEREQQHMTDLPDEQEIGMLPGLPNLLWRNPERLVRMLGLNRKDRRRLASIAPARARARVRRDLMEERGRVTRREEELALIALRFSDPVWRRVAWEDALAGKLERFPSLHFEILRGFVREIRRDPADSESEEERIIARAWMAVRRDLRSWDELDREARERCVLVAFAVASVADDPYLLVEAMESQMDLRDEFEHLVLESMVPEPPLEDRWKKACEALHGLAESAAGPPPDLTAVAPITLAVARLHLLDGALIEEREADARMRLLVQSHILLKKIPKSPGFAWLDETRRASMLEAWRSESETLYPDEAAEEEARLRSALDPAVEAVRQAATACDTARARVTACREARPRSPFRRRTWRASLAELQAEEHECEQALDSSREALLHAASPFGRWSGEISDPTSEREGDAREGTLSSDGAVPDAPQPRKARAWTDDITDVGEPAPTLSPGLPRFLDRDPGRLSDFLGLSRRYRRLFWHRASAIEKAGARKTLRGEGQALDPVAQEQLVIQVRQEVPSWRLLTFHDALQPEPAEHPCLVFSVLEPFVERSGSEPEDFAFRRERIAERAWDFTRERLEEWNDLDDAGKEKTILRVFAVATLRDDPSVLIEAGRIEPALVEEFEPILEQPPAAPPEPVEDPGGEWTRLTRRLGEMAREAAGPPPGIEALAEIQTLSVRLIAIGPAVKEQMAWARIGGLLDDVGRALDEFSADPLLSWFDKAMRHEIRERWKTTAKSLSDEQIGAERERIAAEIQPAWNAVTKAEQRRAEVERRVVAKREERPRGALDRGDWRASLAALQDEEYRCEEELEDAQRALVAAVSPPDSGPPADS